MTNPDLYRVDRLVKYDVECYPNYFLVGFKMPNGEVYQATTPAMLRYILQQINLCGFVLCGFNSNNYDDIVSAVFLAGENLDSYNAEAEAYKVTVELIEQDANPWNYESIDSVDLMPLLNDRMSLKQVGVRMNHPRLQELPIAPGTYLTEEEMEIIRVYNINDLDITGLLAVELSGELELRRAMSIQYGVDLRSKGDAQIAETIIPKRLSELNPDVTRKDMKASARAIIKPGAYVTVSAPTWWSDLKDRASQHQSPIWINHVIQTQEARFNVPVFLNDEGRMQKGSLSSTIYMDDNFYQTGVGGIHSVDGSGCHVAGDNEFLMDVDVASYYPRIALTQKFFPEHIKEHFGEIYSELVETRLKAKKAGNKIDADSLKIVINGAFGKSSEPFSALYDPSVTAGITVIGQVALLLLIAMLADDGIKVVSANTDGITVKGQEVQRETMKHIVSIWEELTGFDMEYTEYRGTYQLDINNYMAVKLDGSIKPKGRFLSPKPGKHDLRHSVNFNVVAEAVKAAVVDCVDVEDYIRSCTDINKFALTQAVTGNWKTDWKGVQLGKLVRFYKSNDPQADAIIRTAPEDAKGNTGNVPNSENCIPIQDLPDQFPQDIDYQWYVDKAEEWLSEVLRPKQSGQNQRAQALVNTGITPAPLKNGPDARASRSYVEHGSLDWNSIPPGIEMGISTGKKSNTVATVDNETGFPQHIYHTELPFPGKTRETQNKRSGFSIVYGATVRMNPMAMPPGVMVMHEDSYRIWCENFYTPAEIKRLKPKVAA
ncbi:MAG: hypothetical protein JRJ45_00375 [Deltaproteobacteria bacterium]|nr:hypothetical protein [Deltaproteobacteria bacterium]